MTNPPVVHMNVSTLSSARPFDVSAGQSTVNRLFTPTTCGWTLPSVGASRETSPKDTTSESTPGSTVLEHLPRGLADRKGHDRLMDTVTPTSDAPPALCPTCGCSSTVAVLRPDGGVMYADYKCRAGHIWITHWLVAA